MGVARRKTQNTSWRKRAPSTRTSSIGEQRGRASTGLLPAEELCTSVGSSGDLRHGYSQDMASAAEHHCFSLGFHVAPSWGADFRIEHAMRHLLWCRSSHAICHHVVRPNGVHIQVWIAALAHINRHVSEFSSLWQSMLVLVWTAD